jgi:hypothetical protein
MARIRTVKPDYFSSRDIVRLSPLARLLYIGLWCEADRDGRLRYEPETFKYRYLPGDNCDVAGIVGELLAGGLVVLYGDGLAHIPTFKRHQVINGKEAPSILPAPPQARVTEIDPRVTDACLTRPGGKERKEGKGKEGKGEEDTPPLVLVPTPTFDGDYGAMPTRKRNPAMAWEGQREGLGVPTRLHTDLLSRMGTADEPALLAWYGETERAWQGKAVGETCWQFWNARFAEWQGQTPTRKGHRPYGVGTAAPSASVAVVDQNYNGAPYRFHCAHTPPCTTWPQHRDAEAVAS